MVMGVVLFTCITLIQRGYELHDTVTGTMILTETMQKLRYGEPEEEEKERILQQGNELGNPRLWLGAYEIELEETIGKMTGTAAAGGWKAEIQMGKFQPGEYLRRCEALRELQGD